MAKEIKNTETVESAPLQKPIEAWAAELRTPSWQLAALKQYKKYAEGKVLSRAEFETGITAALHKPMRG